MGRSMHNKIYLRKRSLGRILEVVARAIGARLKG